MAWNQQVMFPEEFISLQRELQHHPDLIARLGNHAPDEFEIRIAEIASYCEVILDGDYTEKDFRNIAKICEQKLWNKRVAPRVQVIRTIK